MSRHPAYVYPRDVIDQVTRAYYDAAESYHRATALLEYTDAHRPAGEHRLAELRVDAAAARLKLATAELAHVLRRHPYLLGARLIEVCGEDGAWLIHVDGGAVVAQAVPAGVRSPLGREWEDTPPLDVLRRYCLGQLCAVEAPMGGAS